MGALFFGVAIASSRLAAVADPICADRPGQSTPTCTVAPGHWQVETGLADWSLQKSAGERDTALALGETTMRYGVTGRSDIQVDFTPWQRATSSGPGGGAHASSFGDVSILYKHRLTADDAALQVALMPVVKIPTAKHWLGNGKWEGALLVPIDITLGKSPLALNLTPEIDWAADAEGRGHHPAMVQVASLGWQATNKVSVSAELWHQWDWDPSGTTLQVSADGSAAYLLSDDVQLDAGANFGLNRATSDVEIYAGFAKRF